MPRTTVTLLAALLALSACAPADDADAGPAPDAAAAPPDAEVRAELESRMAGFTEAMLSNDVERIMPFWTEDAHLLEPGMDMDRAGLEQFLGETFAAGGAIVAFETRPREVFVHGDAAYELGSYDETVRPATDAEPTTVENHYFLRWERSGDGVWRLDRVVTGARAAPDGM